MIADEYRKQAAALEKASKIHLASLDTDKPGDKLLLGILGGFKASMFEATADIMDFMAESATPQDKAATRNHRMRMAALRGDDAAMQAIMDEIEDELTAKSEQAESSE